MTELTKARLIISDIHLAGGEAFIVGGFVRDSLLGKKSNDIDIATNLHYKELLKIFPKGQIVGESFSVMKYNGIDIATYRTESNYEDGRRPSNVKFVKTLKEDLKRRDFTINALAMDYHGRIIDYFGGLKDLENKTIKVINDFTFKEDSLRILRAFRFAAQLDFKISTDTMTLIIESRENLKNLSYERISMEFFKILERSKDKRKLSKLLHYMKEYLNIPLLFNTKPYYIMNYIENFTLEEKLSLLYESYSSKDYLELAEKYKFKNSEYYNKVTEYLVTKTLDFNRATVNEKKNILIKMLISQQMFKIQKTFIRLYNSWGFNKNKLTLTDFYLLPKNHKNLALSVDDIIELGVEYPQLGCTHLELQKVLIFDGLLNTKEVLTKVVKQLLKKGESHVELQSQKKKN